MSEGGVSVQEEKSKLRKLLRACLADQTSAQHQRLQRHLIDWLSGQTGTWGAYWPLSGEPELQNVWNESTHLTWVFPRMDGENLRFHRPQGEQWVIGAYGVREPAAFTPTIELHQVRGLLIPGLGFDRQGRRLGKGKGFYDRLLGGFEGIRVGVGFENQWVSEIPVDEFDQKVDLIVTEAGPWCPSEG